MHKHYFGNECINHKILMSNAHLLENIPGPAISPSCFQDGSSPADADFRQTEQKAGQLPDESLESDLFNQASLAHSDENSPADELNS